MKLLILILILVLIFLILKLNNSSKFKSSFGVNCKPLPNIDKIFLLTLKSSNERRAKFTSSFNKNVNDIPLEIIWGINTKDPKNAEPYRKLVDPYNFKIMYQLDKGTRNRTKLSEFNSGALGCYLGHMEFYKKCFEQKLDYALICEDNIVFDKNFNTEWKTIRAPSDFDIIFFHAWDKISEGKSCGMEKLKKVMGTKCYLINVKSMKKYYDLFYPINNHVDLKYKDIINRGCNIYYYPLNSIEVVYTTTSTIGHSLIVSQLFSNVDPNEISHKLFEIE